MIKKIKIYDLDGTLIDSSHRYRTDETGKRIDLDYWRKNETPEKIMQDKFLALKSWLDIDLKRRDTYVIFATARACIKGDTNYQFLQKHGIMPDKFIHRQGATDSRGGAALKISGIKPILNLAQFKHATIHIFEDNINYLYDMVQALKGRHPIVGHFIPSKQGH